MPRKEQILTIEQLNEIIEGRASEETFSALQKWAKAELYRRERAGRAKPKTSDKTRKEQVRDAVRRFRAKNK